MDACVCLMSSVLDAIPSAASIVGEAALAEVCTATQCFRDAQDAGFGHRPNGASSHDHLLLATALGASALLLLSDWRASKA